MKKIKVGKKTIARLILVFIFMGIGWQFGYVLKTHIRITKAISDSLKKDSLNKILRK